MHHDLVVAIRSGVLLCLLAVGCGQANERADATLGYTTSGCKSKTGQALTVDGEQATTYDGLKCVAWEVGADKTTFRLYNFEGGCGAQYAGQAHLDASGQAVTLSLTNPSGAVAACGWCIYDYVFQVKGAAAGVDLSVAVERSNDAQPGKLGTDNFVLPAQASPQGVVCQYGHRFALGDHARKTGTAGMRNMPCADEDPALTPPCRTGLACTAVDPAGDHRVCLAACAADADCGDSQLYRCAGGGCRLAESGDR